MAGEFDAVMKTLVEGHPEDWLWLAGLEGTPPPVAVIDADVSTVTAAADKVLRIEEPFAGAPAWLLHFELSSGHDLGVVERMSQYRSLLVRRHGLSVASALVLLRPSANSPRFDGVLRTTDRLGKVHTFGYEVVRLWAVDPDRFLTGGLGTLGLALLARVVPAEVPRVLERINERVRVELTPQRREDFWASLGVLMALQFDRSEIQTLIQEARGMEDNVLFSVLRDIGAERHARRTLLRMGAIRFGPPDELTRTTIEAIKDLGRLDDLLDRLLGVGSWAELLSEVAPER